MKKITIVNALNLIMEGKLKTEQIFFFVENVGYVQVDEIYFYCSGVNLHNCEIDIDVDYDFTDKIFIQKEE